MLKGSPLKLSGACFDFKEYDLPDGLANAIRPSASDANSTNKVLVFTSPPGGTLDTAGPYGGSVTLSSGQFLSGGTNGVPQGTALVAGSGISLTPGASSLTITSSATSSGTPNSVAYFNNSGVLSGTVLGSSQVLSGNPPAPIGNVILDSVNGNTVFGPGASIGAGNTNATALGNGATTTANNQVMLGNASVTQVVKNASATVDIGTTANAFSNVYLTGLGWATNSIILNEACVNATLSASDVAGMSASPFLLVAAPGAGKMILVRSAVLNYIGGSAAFTSGGTIVIQYGNTATGAGTSATNSSTGMCASTFLTSGTSSKVEIATGLNPASSGDGGVVATTYSNKGIYISNKTAAFATGTGASLNVTLSYLVLPVS